MTVIVNGRPFFGRREEQRDFGTFVERFLSPSADEINDSAPFIMYLYGDGGIGKSTLLKRFYDMVQERFRDRCEVLTLDWEREQNETSRTILKVGHDNITATALLDTLYQRMVADRPDWEKALEPYRTAVTLRERIRLHVEQLFLTMEPTDPLAPLRGVGATFLAKLLSATAEGYGAPIGEGGETVVSVLAEMGLKAGEERARQIAGLAEKRLKDSLSSAEIAALLDPDKTMAKALGNALRQMTTKNRRKLVFFLDTYEIVDNADFALRHLMRSAGVGTLWVVAGRNDLVASRLYGKNHYIGYPQAFPTRFKWLDVKQLALDDVSGYFETYVPERPLNENTLLAIFQATHAIPLAVREAADIWKKGLPLSEIVRDIPTNVSGRQIVATMTERYHIHCINNPDDRYALYAIALAEQDVGLLRAMLQPTNEPQWDMDQRLRYLERTYASVHRHPARLHEEAAFFFRDFLREEEQRTAPRTVEMIKRALRYIYYQLKKTEAPLRLIEDRHADEGWRKRALQLTDFLFWLGETDGWKWFAPRFVESTVYSGEMRKGLLDVVKLWQLWFEPQGKKWVERLIDSLERKEELEIWLEEIRGWRDAGWLKGEEEYERLAIITFLKANLLKECKRYDEALRVLNSITRLPEQGTLLNNYISGKLLELGYALIYSGGKVNWQRTSTLLDVAKTANNLNRDGTIKPFYILAALLSGETQEAFSLIDTYLNDNSNINLEAIQTICNGLLMQGLYKEVVDFSHYVSIEETSLDLLVLLSYAYMLSGNINECINVSKICMEKYNSWEAAQNLCSAYIKLGEYKLANDVALIGLRWKKTNLNLQVDLIHILENLNLFHEAKATFQIAVRIMGDEITKDEMDFHYYIGCAKLHMYLGRMEDAISILNSYFNKIPTQFMRSYIQDDYILRHIVENINF